MSLLHLAQTHLPGLSKKSAKEWAGPCPKCGGEDRFIVGGKRPDVFYCRGCHATGGEVAFLRLLGRSCPEAHEEAGVPCHAADCPAERCRLREGGPVRTPRPPKTLRPPASAARAPEFQPAAAEAPGDLWTEKAAKLVEHAHQALLECPEQLAYLAGRGLPLAAVQQYRLGWLPDDLYRPRQAWGLPELLRDDGKPKKLFLPAGLVLPFFDAEGLPFRLRIRRRTVHDGQPRYYWVPGSGDDVAVLGPQARAFVVVESDLDGFLVHHHAGDLVGAIPLGTVGLKPKQAAHAALQQALSILVALDCEPRVNAKTGRHENPGLEASAWWERTFKRAKRWPVAHGKDPGEYAEQGGDIRAWVLAGLPPVFHVPPQGVHSQEAAVREVPAGVHQEGANGVREAREYLLGTSKGGIPYLVASTPEVLARASELHPGRAAFLRSELDALRGLPQEQLHAVLRVKQAFPEGRVLSSLPQ